MRKWESNSPVERAQKVAPDRQEWALVTKLFGQVASRRSGAGGLGVRAHQVPEAGCLSSVVQELFDRQILKFFSADRLFYSLSLKCIVL